MYKPLKTFIIYSREDKIFKEQLIRHLKPIIAAKQIEVWHDGNILPGEDWEIEIKKNLKLSELILVLVSVNALDSDFIQTKELEAALENLKFGFCRIIPIVISPCLWSYHPVLKGLQGLPTDMKPIDSWNNINEAWTDVVQKLAQMAEEIQNMKIEKIKNKEKHDKEQREEEIKQKEIELENQQLEYKKAIEESLKRSREEEDHETFKNAATVAELEQYIKNFSQHVNEAKAKIKELRFDEMLLNKDNQAFNRAVKLKTLKSIISYLKEFPAGVHVEKANQIKLELELLPKKKSTISIFFKPIAELFSKEIFKVNLLVSSIVIILGALAYNYYKEQRFVHYISVGDNELKNNNFQLANAAYLGALAFHINDSIVNFKLAQNGYLEKISRFDKVYEFKEGFAIVRKKEKEKWRYGHIDKSGTLVADKLNYDTVFNYSEGIAGVRQNGRFFFIDTNGTPLYSKKTFDEIDNFVDGKAWFSNSGIIGFISKDGKISELNLKEMGYSWFDRFNGEYCLVKKTNKYGLVNRKSIEVIQCIYDELLLLAKDKIIIAKKNNKYGIISFNNKAIVGFKYDKLYSLSGNLFLAKVAGKYGVITQKDSIKQDFKYWYASFYPDQNNYFDIGYSNSQFGLMNLRGEFVLPPIYSSINYIYDLGYYKVKKQNEDLLGVVDKNNNKIISFDYEYIGSFYENVAIAKIKGKYGLISSSGRRITDFKFDKISTAISTYYFITINNKVGYMNNNGKIILEPIKDEFFGFSDDLCGVKQSGYSTYFMNEKGEKILEINEFGCKKRIFHSGYLGVSTSSCDSKSNWGYIDKKGKIVIECKYEDVSAYWNSNKEVKVKRGGKWQYIDKNGKFLRHAN